MPLQELLFLSTLSLRRAADVKYKRDQTILISIHALLAESGLVLLTPKSTTEHFYPRSPCGERPWHIHGFLRGLPISIHALLAESGIKNAEAVSKYMIFLSTLSLRRAAV